MPDAPYTLDPRPLRKEDHDRWVRGFNAGKEYWATDVNRFLSDQAWTYQHRGNCRTTLFSFPGTGEIVGFFTVASASFPLAELEKGFDFSKQDRPKELSNLYLGGVVCVPIVHLIYIGVDQEHHPDGGQGRPRFGLELHTRLLENIEDSFAGARFVLLEVFAESYAFPWYGKKLGYRELSRAARRPKGLDEEKDLVTMALDLLRD